MRILGLANGTPGGNSEILLKAALVAAAATSEQNTTSWIHAPSVLVPRNPKPLEGTADISMGTNSSMTVGDSHGEVIDDRAAVLDAILEADALMFSTPVYSHQPAGALKALLDKILGPYADAALAQRINEGKRKEDPVFSKMPLDERILKPRVVGFIVVAGSTTPDQVTMALPTLHQLVYSLHAKVVDQHIFLGIGNPGAVLLPSDDTNILRAKELGLRVASQLGKSFDEAQYLGADSTGTCPHCHLSKIDYFGAKHNEIGCVVCGNTGMLVVKEDGFIEPIWDEDSDYCCITMRGKQKHIDDIFEGGEKESKALNGNEQVTRKLRMWRDLDIAKVSLPSETVQLSKVASLKM